MPEKPETKKRFGVTLVEALIVLSVVAVCVALLFVGIAKVRLQAASIRSQNQLKNMALAYQQIVEERSNRKGFAYEIVPGGGGILTAMLPFLGDTSKSDGEKYYISKLDPSLPYRTVFANGRVKDPGTSSFALNSTLIREAFSLHEVVDGTSQTLLFVERYSNCSPLSSVYWSLTGNICTNAKRQRIPCPHDDRRATFADSIYPDIVPLFDRSQSKTVGFPTNIPFQVVPRYEECNPSVPQAFMHDGIGVAKVDGSVVRLRSTIDPSLFWSQVTPRGHEIATD